MQSHTPHVPRSKISNVRSLLETLPKITAQLTFENFYNHLLPVHLASPYTLTHTHAHTLSLTETHTHMPARSTDTVYERLRGVAREEEGSTEKIREIVEEEEVGEVEEEDDWQLMRTLSLAEEDAVLCLRRQRLAHFKVFQPPVGPS